MNIIVTGRHLDITPAIRDYAEGKVQKFKKYISPISEAVVTLSVEKYRHKAEVLLKANGVMIQAESVTEEIYSAIDEVVEKLERQVKKYKEKLTSKRNRQPSQSEPPVETEPELSDIRIIKRKRFAMKPMTPEEAAMQMELLDKDFFVFTNAESGIINVIYKRRDGDFGLIEPA
ncbi:MAG: ribosome-associated translation inhibitor RaiA [Nitrospirae bacterium]|nr:MAG: ribosome-associated translation inhibitor RaiA [Nitrospirota bacterium]